MDDYVTLQELVELTKLSKATLYRLVEQGKLTIYKLGGGKRSYFKRSEVESLFAPGEYHPKSDPDKALEAVGV